MPSSGPLGLSLRGLLRFLALLIAACLVGALFGLITEPIETGAASTRPGVVPPATTAEKATSDLPQGGVATESERKVETTADPEPGARTREAFAPDLRGLYIAGGALLAFAALAMMLSRKTRGARPGNGAVHLVDTLHLGAGRRIHLLRVDGRRFLVGNSERGLHFLASVPQSDTERAFDTAMAAGEDEIAAAEGEPTFDRSLLSALAGSSAR